MFETDHEPIRYLQTKSRLSGRQQRWLDEIQSYNFDVNHVPGIKNVVPDALGRRPDHNPHLHQMSLKDPGFRIRLAASYEQDPWSLEMIKTIQDSTYVSSNDKVNRQQANYKFDGTLLHWVGTYNPRVYIPDVESLRSEVMDGFHSSGYLGTDKVFNSIARHAYWPNMYDDVANYVASCRDCQSNKMPNQLPAGELQPFEVPDRCWDVVTADFLSEFPKNERGHDTVLVIVDKLSKRSIFVPTSKDIDSPSAARLFEAHLFSKHGVPIRIVSDRDPKF